VRRLWVIVEAATAADRGGEDWYRKEIRVPRKKKYREQPSARTDTTSLELLNLSKSDVIMWTKHASSLIVFRMFI
jgi:hypothetical protein